MALSDDRQIRERMAALRQQHRDLDDAIAALETAGSADLLQIKRLKKQKLKLKDEIQLLEDKLLPDIIA
ncbi:MAG: DUF465 domain-containing protein [Hyphomicrobiaceae bacterium]